MLWAVVNCNLEICTIQPDLKGENKMRRFKILNLYIKGIMKNSFVERREDKYEKKI